MTALQTVPRTALLLLLLSGGGAALAQDIALRPFEVKGIAALTSGDFRTCAAVFAKATREHGAEPSPAFNAARCSARAGDTTAAARYLRIALSRGYRNCANLQREPALAAIGGAAARCEANAEAFVRASNPELLAAYLDDRADRAGPIDDPQAVLQRDRVRQNVVRIALAHHALRTADDYLHAALVMQHGSTTESYVLARDLARTAVRLRPWLAEARWLYAAATDRTLWSAGKPQIFGTQYKQVDGKWTLEPFDPGAISDAERARWRTHSLAERRKFIDGLNARK